MNINSNSFKQFIRFVIVGGGATLLHYSIYFFSGLYINNNLAYTLGYAISFIFNFIVSSYFTFSTTPTKKGGIRFLLAHTFNYFLQIILLNIYIYIGIGRVIAPFLVFAVSIPVNFIFVKKALKGN
ncbi:MAG: GtrA family protein [Clostridium sp.]